MKESCSHEANATSLRKINLNFFAVTYSQKHPSLTQTGTLRGIAEAEAEVWKGKGSIWQTEMFVSYSLE